MGDRSERIWAVDPGLGSLGIAALDIEIQQKATVRSVAYFESSKAKAKLNILAADDTAERARELHRFLCAFWDEQCPTGSTARSAPAPRAILAEAQSWPRNAGASAKVGVAWGVLVAFADARDLPILQLSPQKVKKQICGAMTASKDEVETNVRTRTLWADNAAYCMTKIKQSAHEHVFDAIAVGLCAYSHPGWSLTRGGRS
jgi:Holliday junction resolvasome RuvABC endonuclease subunit